MSGDASRTEDPFAGYTPVKPAKPVVDDDVPDIPQTVRRRKKRRPSEKKSLRGRVWLWIASAVLTVVVAAVAYGFIYGRTDKDLVPEVAAFLERVKPLSDFGRDIRDKVSEFPVLKSLVRTAERRQGDVECASPMSASVTNVVMHKERMKIAQQVADGENADGATEGAEMRDSSAGGMPAAPRPEKHKVDPRLKEFKTGGRTGRPLR